MNLFLATLAITLVCCLLLSIGLLLAGRPLKGGCGNAPPGSPRCAGCPRQGQREPSECPNRGDH